MLKRWLPAGFLITGVLVAGCNWCGGNGFLRTASSRNPDKNPSTLAGSGEVIVQEGVPIIEEGPTVTIGQQVLPVAPGVSTQTVPPPTAIPNNLPLAPTPTSPAPKLVPQAQPAPANPTSFGVK